MKILTVLLILTLFSSAAHQSAGASTTTVVARSDSITPLRKHNAGKTHKVLEGASVVSFMAAIAAVAGTLLIPSSGLLLFLTLFSVILGLVGLARIKTSHGKLGGGVLALLGIVLSISWLSFILWLLSRFT